MYILHIYIYIVYSKWYMYTEQTAGSSHGYQQQLDYIDAENKK